MNCIMKCDLVGLVMHLKLNCAVMGSNLGLDKIIDFLFLSIFIFLGRNVKGREKPS